MVKLKRSYFRYGWSLAVLFAICTTKVSANIDSLYQQSDIVVLAQISSISGGFTHDLGTDHYFVTLQVESVYKQNFVPLTQPFQLHWIVSNLRCNLFPSSKCISEYEGGTYIFFLKRAHFFEGDEIPPGLIHAADTEAIEILSSLRAQGQVVVQPFKSQNPCDSTCTFCKHVHDKNWKKVKKHIAKNANAERRNNWMHHRRVKYVLPDRYILSSLPSYQSVRMQFIIEDEEVEALVSYQVGYYKSFATWIPSIAYSLFNAQWYHHFSRENYDTLMLKSFTLHTNSSQAYLAHERKEYERQIQDTAWIKTYGQNKPLDSMLVLLASAYEGPTELYVDYITMPDYTSKALAYIDSLTKYKHVYSLCILAHHAHPDVAAYSVDALKKLGDKTAVPFLIDLAEFEISAGFYTSQYVLRNALRKSLITTLDYLTETQTLSRSYPHGLPENTAELAFSLPLWRSKINLVDYSGLGY